MSTTIEEKPFIKDVTDLVEKAGWGRSDFEAWAAHARSLNPCERVYESRKARHGESFPGWEKQLVWKVNSKGEEVSLERHIFNVSVYLNHHPKLAGALAFDEFSLQTMAVKEVPWNVSYPRVWTDVDDLYLQEFLFKHCGLDVSREIVGSAVEKCASDNPINELKDWLLGLEWKEKPRLNTWLIDYAGAEAETDEQRKYLTTVGPKWMISACARALMPGCKADHVLVLEGRQGIRKSTLARVLGGKWFSDDLGDIGPKDTAIQLAGRWIVELGELANIRGKAIEKVKSFISRSEDIYRPPYAKRTISAKRSCVFIGTTNDDRWISDSTGGRRFWPVHCTSIDIKSLERDREQLWAEAMFRYRKRERWHLSVEDEVAAAKQQEARYEADPWEDAIIEWIEKPAIPREEISIRDVLVEALDVKVPMITQADSNRVARCLKKLGWRQHRVFNNGKTYRLYYRDEDATH
jgi:predicted P-loop ATPase